MGFLHKFERADYKMICILITIIAVCVCANVGWVILAVRNYLNYTLNLYIQVPLDVTASIIFNYFAYRVISQMARDEPKIWTVTVHLSRDALFRCLRCCRRKGDYGRAHDLNFSFSDNDKCSICWDPYDAQSPQYLLDCGHRFHQHCLDEFEADHSIYYQCPQCRTLYHEDSKWNYQYAYHLLHA